ncbi:MAG: YggS family pyridoxal phosphate-dependent enzyme [Flavicella sp.]
MSISKRLQATLSELPNHVTLVAVSKTKPITALQEAYDAGQRIFGENRVQEMVEKYHELPKDISWHLIGHLQKNKVKYIAPFVSLIHGIDSYETLLEVDKQAKKHNRTIACLLQIKIATEDSKFGLNFETAKEILANIQRSPLKNVYIKGLMGMATFTENKQQIQKEFSKLHTFFKTSELEVLSMGMSGDYKIAIEEGSSMIRVGSAIFGSRQ